MNFISGYYDKFVTICKVMRNHWESPMLGVITLVTGLTCLLYR